MRFAFLAFALITPPAFGQTGDDYRGLEAATEALFQAYRVEISDPFPVLEAVQTQTPVSFESAQDLASQGVNFAGRHVLSVMGCGTECQAIYLLNPAPGHRFASVVSGHGVEFRADSSLLILNPPYELTYFGSDEVPERLAPQCLVYLNGEFEAVACQGVPG